MHVVLPKFQQWYFHREQISILPILGKRCHQPKRWISGKKTDEVF